MMMEYISRSGYSSSETLSLFGRKIQLLLCGFSMMSWSVLLFGYVIAWATNLGLGIRCYVCGKIPPETKGNRKDELAMDVNCKMPIPYNCGPLAVSCIHSFNNGLSIGAVGELRGCSSQRVPEGFCIDVNATGAVQGSGRVCYCNYDLCNTFHLVPLKSGADKAGAGDFRTEADGAAANGASGLSGLSMLMRTLFG